MAVRGRGGVVGGCGEWLPADRRSRGFVRPVAEVFWCGRVSGCRPLAQCGFGAEPSDAARQGLRRLPLLGDRFGSPRCVAVSRRRVPPRRPRAGQWRCSSATRCAASPGRPVPAPRRNALPPDEQTHSTITDQPIIPGTPEATVSRKVADHPSSWIGDGSLVDACTVTGLPRSGDQPPQVRSSAMLRCQHDGPAIDDVGTCPAPRRARRWLGLARCVLVDSRSDYRWR